MLSTGNSHDRRPKVVGFYNSHSANGSNSDFYIDDAYIDNTWARVEICSGATWLNKGGCEIQSPTAWSDTSVTVTVNQGAFNSGGTAYIYVVNDNGNVSPGYSVTF